MTNHHKKGRTKHCTVCACEYPRIRKMTDEEWKERRTCYTSSCEEMAALREAKKPPKPREKRAIQPKRDLSNLPEWKACEVCKGRHKWPEGKPAAQWDAQKTCQSADCIARARATCDSKKMQTYLAVPEPEPREKDMLIRRVETPLTADSVARYRMPQIRWYWT